jgi:hypothetical protein
MSDMLAAIPARRYESLVRIITWARYGLMFASFIVLWVLVFSLVAYGFEGNWPCGLESSDYWFSRGCGIPALTRPGFEWGGVSALWPTCAGALITLVVLWMPPEARRRLHLGLLASCCALLGWAWMQLWARVPMSWATASLVLAVLAAALVAVEPWACTRSTRPRPMFPLVAAMLAIFMTAGAVSAQSKSRLPDLIDHQVLARQSASSVIGPAGQSRGPELAKFTFVIFFDPTCPWTLKAYREAIKLVTARPDVRLVVRPASFGGYYTASRRYVEKLLSLDVPNEFWKQVDALADIQESNHVRLTDHVRTLVPESDDLVTESPEARSSREFAERIKAKATPLILLVGPDHSVRMVKRTTNLAFYVR